VKKVTSREWSHTIMKELTFKRDNFTCVKCGKKKEIINGMINLIADHITPISLGGELCDLNNIQTLCTECNKKKNAIDQSNIAKRKREARRRWMNK